MNDRNNMKPCRRDLLREINEVSFAVDDVQLFLDTHPCDEEAMQYFQEYSQKRNELLKKFLIPTSPITPKVSLNCLACLPQRLSAIFLFTYTLSFEIFLGIRLYFTLSSLCLSSFLQNPTLLVYSADSQAYTFDSR